MKVLVEFALSTEQSPVKFHDDGRDGMGGLEVGIGGRLDDET